MRAQQWSHQRPEPENKRAAFSGRHVLAHFKRTAKPVNMPESADCKPKPARTIPEGRNRNPAWHKGFFTLHTQRNMWNASADSCAGVTAYCSVFPVGYDISCGSFDPLSLVVGRTRPGAHIAPGEP